MKYLVAVAVMAVGLYGLAIRGAGAGTEPGLVLEHHTTQHSLGPCGPHPCPSKPDEKSKSKRR